MILSVYEGTGRKTGTVVYKKDTLKGFAGPRRAAPSSPLQAELRNIESLYRSALSGAVVAKARYLALNEGASTPAAAARAYSVWKQLEARRRVLAIRRSRLEALKHAVVLGSDIAVSEAAEFRLTPAPGRIT
jgi:hypothetical protein